MFQTDREEHFQEYFGVIVWNECVWNEIVYINCI